MASKQQIVRGVIDCPHGTAQPNGRLPLSIREIADKTDIDLHTRARCASEAGTGVYTRRNHFPEADGMIEGEGTVLLEAAASGDAGAMQSLFARVYGELKQIARKRLAASAGHSLDTTGLVHEAYLKIAQRDAPALQGHAHFFALAAKAMRQIVIDHARARATAKRGGANLRLVDIDENVDVADGELGPEALLRLNHALELLEAAEPRLAQLVELRFFAGLSVGDISRLREVSERTLDRDWRRAKALLYTTLHPGT